MRVNADAALDHVGQPADRSRGQVEETRLGDEPLDISLFIRREVIGLERSFNAQAGEPAALHYSNSQWVLPS